jgi:hypothetical protein
MMVNGDVDGGAPSDLSAGAAVKAGADDRHRVPIYDEIEKPRADLASPLLHGIAGKSG